MGGKTDYLENALLDHVKGGPDYERPATTWIRLCITAPTDSVAGTEVSISDWTNYAPEAVTNNATNWPAAVGSEKSNGVDIDFGTAVVPGADVDVTHWEEWDAASGGNRLYWGEVVDADGDPATKHVSEDDLIKFAAGTLVVTED